MARERVSKSKEVLPTGRSSKGVPKFENWHCRVFPKDFTYPSWRSITSPTAKDVAHICRAKSDHSAALGKKDESGKPIFEFTASEAERVFHIPRPTFESAIQQIIRIGFIEIARHGGIMCGKGIPTLYRLSEKWKTFTPPARDHSNIMKARAARKKHGGDG